jgi:hypothetical protein
LGVDIFESNTNQLVLSARAYANLMPEKWNRRLLIAKLEVLETPLDGFGDLGMSVQGPKQK